MAECRLPQAAPLAAQLALAVPLLVGSFAHASQVRFGHEKPSPHPLTAQFGAMRLNDAKFVTTDAERAEIDRLIRSLRFEGYPQDRMWMSTDPGTIFMVGGYGPRESDPPAAAFAPTAGDWQLVLVPEAWKLIDLGPKAIPALLAALDDGTPVATARGLSGSFTTSEDDHFPISRSNANRREGSILEAMLPAQKPSKQFFGEEDQVARGDLAGAILGQIVHRDYRVFDRKVVALDTASPVRNPNVADALRKIWAGNPPQRALAASLAEDLSRDGNSASGAIGRLGYYFPEEAADVIVAALDGGATIGLDDVALDRSAIWALAAHAPPRTMEALGRRLASAQSAPEIAALLVPAVIEAHGALAQAKLITLASQSGSELWWQPHRVGFSTAIALMPEESRAAVEQAFTIKDPAARMAILGALYRGPTSPSWLAEVVCPLLTDETKTQSTFGVPRQSSDGPDYLRVKDAAAVLLAKHLPDVVFDPSVGVADRDAAIARAQVTLDSIARGDHPRTAAIPRIAPVASVTLKDPNAYVWFSRASTVDRVVGMTLGNCGGIGVRLFDILPRTGVVNARLVRQADGGAAPESLTMMRESRDGKALVTSGDAIFSLDPDTGALARLGVLPSSDHATRGRGQPLIIGDRIFTTNAQGDLLATSFLDGATETIWKCTVQPKDDAMASMGLRVSLSRCTDPDRVIVEIFASDEPSTVVDLTTRVAAPLTGLPNMGWSGGVGRYASNNLNSFGTLWDLSTLKQVALPVPSADLDSLVGTRDGAIVIGRTKAGEIVVIDMKAHAVVALLGAVGEEERRPVIFLSEDERSLVCATTITDAATRSPPSAIEIAVYDVVRWTGSTNR